VGGKLKGQAAKWLRRQSGERLARGYFACTAGKSTASQVDGYLSTQGEHHGYAHRARPPAYVQTFTLTAVDDERLQPPNAQALLRYHLVLSSWRRHGVFGDVSGPAISRAWRSLEVEHKFALLKVSFVADHVHLAVRVHPTIAPASLVVELMNAAQRIMWRDFMADVIQARVERLWQPAAYIGSFGELATPQLEAYLRRWGDD
jgi:REP element-mobilizing transposase RayT